MAGVVVDVVIERLATLALDKIERELKLVTGVKEEINNLIDKLKAIRAVLEDAEQRQVMEASVKLWLDDLNDVAFDMDDVLDEWITRVEKHKLEKQVTHGADAVVTAKKKVCFPFPSSCFRFRQVNYQLFLRHEIAKKIEELNKSLTKIDGRKLSFSFQNITRAVPQLPHGVERQTTSLPNVKTFGRDEERNFIVSRLMSESSEENKNPRIIPIVGMGGMGKTSLANLVYNDDRIQSHFGDMRIWVCVSDPFEVIKIAQAIIETLDKNHPSKNSNDLQILLKCIFDLIKGKKFLLVLDDVWYPKSTQWEEFIKPLRNAAMGSRLLVTSRNEQVATLMNATSELVLMRNLGKTFCLSLFYYSANKDEKTLSNEFRDIGLEIVKRCNGSPLATKTLGSLMRNKKNIHEWRTVLNSKIWTLKEFKEDIFRPLLLSYHDLDPAIKHCLLYCVLFPKDYEYNKTTLIELWMSQDYLNGKETSEQRITGQNYYDELVRRSFFQDVEVDEKNGNITCKIHDTVHDFLHYCTEDQHTSERKHVVRHLTTDDVPECAEEYILGQRKIRTFTATAADLNEYVMEPILESLVQLKCLRTIILSRLGRYRLCVTYVCIPKMIGELIHLRYLDLSGNEELRELPDAMGSLYNLQTLRLVGCKFLKRIDVRRLVKLRHLYVEGCRRLWIQGIEKLTDLHRLDAFSTEDDDHYERNKLEDLKDLEQLQGSLAIWISGNPNIAAGIMLNNAQLLELQLRFFSSENNKQIMNALKPHPALESLLITCYSDDVFSDWLSSLHCLRVLSLEMCMNCNILPPLGKLESLESLDIERFEGIRKVGVEFLGIEQGQSDIVSFPKLKRLTIHCMESLEEWQGVQEENSLNVKIMPCLDHLTISYCPKLKALPDFLWNTPLKELHIKESRILRERYRIE